MSTRSGKRIHSSFENVEELEKNNVKLKNEKKTKTKRRKGDTDDSNAVLNETAHYVHYPGDEALKDNLEKSSRKLRRHTLKEHHDNVTNKQNSDDIVDPEKPRHMRKSKRFVRENEFDITENKQSGAKEETEFPKKAKKNKKKKQNVIVEQIEMIEEAVKENVPKGKKKSKKKKHSKQSGELKVEDNLKNSSLNKSDASIDSFHSAAGSPESVKPNGIISKLIEDTLSNKDDSDTPQKPSKKSVTQDKLLKRSSTLITNSDDDYKTTNEVVENETTTKRKSSRNRKSLDQTAVILEPTDIECPTKNIRAKKTNSSFDSSNTKLNLTFEKSIQHNSTDENKEENVNGTFDKSNPKLNNTFEKSEQKHNETFEMPIDKGSDSKYEINEASQIRRSKRKSLNIANDESQTKHSLNSTYEKSPIKSKINERKSLNSTFDKGSGGESLPINEQAPATDEKSDSVNTTFNKSPNHSHISINSDDSKTENIINTTPQLVESSMEESGILVSPKTRTPQSTSAKSKESAITPLKREGTFTKDSPKVETPKSQPATPKSKTRHSMMETPNKRKSLSSPGRTPFPASKTSEKKNKTLNVTHSIEKSMTRASIAEAMPRMTKVMFCSPIYDPVIGSQIKRKVIKSNLKGSNKSFVFDESMSETRRSVNRKRSYTQSDAETVQNKRSRIGEEMQQSIDRLSRPRTVSASAKLSEPSTPSKKTPTKARTDPKVSRTKLPNFAALHQKRFEKMESLDECQERKAKRAKQLLTPTGSVNILERISPKENVAESPKSTHTKNTKKHTLESLNPGYTRFGFRMNCDDNPFTNKQTEVKKDKPNGLKRQPTLPSLAGTTSLRRDAAKQTVMREKSFTGKRDTDRKENRTIIKGVRTNRRFELQMKMRNINA